MGIRPNKGEKVEAHYRVDGSTEAQQLITDAEHTGNEAGKIFAEISAQADSASKGTTELAKRVTTLEKQTTQPDMTSISGDGWAAYKRSGMVTIVLTGLEAGFTVPEGYRPPVGIQAPIVRGAGSHDARFGIGTLGAFKMYGTYTTPVTGIVTYPAA